MTTKLSTYAKRIGISYKTAWRLWKCGKLNVFQLPTGTIIVRKEESKFPNKVCVYARASSSENKDNLKRQAKRLREYAIAKGYQIYKIVEEVGSGINDDRKKLTRLLQDKGYNKLIVEHKDTLTRFGFNYIQILFKRKGKEIEVVNETENDKEDLMQDFIAIIIFFRARLYAFEKNGEENRENH